MEFRKTDRGLKTCFRTERLYQDGNGWNYMTREGFVGPFKTAAEADKALSVYKNELALLPSFLQWRTKNQKAQVTQSCITIKPPSYYPIIFRVTG